MAVQGTDLGFFVAASTPTDDVSTSGGAIDPTVRIDLTQWAATAKVALVSDGTDTRTVALAGRLADGTIATENVVLTSSAEVLSVNVYERLLSAIATTTDAVRTVLIKQGASGTTRGTIRPSEKGVRALFYNSSSEAGTAVRYEKLFAKNSHATLAHLGSQVVLVADPAGKLRIGLTAAVNDSTSVANRKTAPPGVTFSDDNVTLPVVGVNLAAGSAQGFWLEQTLAPSDPAQRNTFALQLVGSST